ncbi:MULTISPECIES: hypothetical protein [Acinetobacter]|uniref:hypothetical protein n=1 Tax=Acinetobacter TaxID=469 RepID=UPI0002D04890|nr:MULTISPECIES: hypothetical protein [Acinetobacter]ENX63858.1 hypothetical protein F885_00602 [Acinetobacter higginsii]MCH7317382.1 hypothetical protein [Acinetobacter higginsii]
MTQERATSLRILQTNKKKTLSPVIYLLIGFLSGVIFAALVFFLLFVTDSSRTNTATTQPEQAVEENNPAQAHNTKTTTQSSEETTASHHETAESVEDNNFTQPGSNDLNKFFQRTPPAAAPTPTGQHVSPFANEPNAKSTQVVAPTKPVSGKNEAVPAATNKVVKTAPQTTKTTAPAKTPEVEAEAPEATVQIKVTQKPFAVNELK